MDQQQQNAAAATRASSRRDSDSLALQAGRQLRWPLGALGTLLEGRRGAGLEAAEREFTERAIAELLRAERAATDCVAADPSAARAHALLRWARPLRGAQLPEACSLACAAFEYELRRSG